MKRLLEDEIAVEYAFFGLCGCDTYSEAQLDQFWATRYAKKEFIDYIKRLQGAWS